MADARVYRQALPGTVFVVTKESLGSGALVDADQRLVVTSNHVVGDQSEAVVFFPLHSQGELVGSTEVYYSRVKELGIAARVVERDVQRDLAILQLDKLPAGAQALTISRERPTPGDVIHTIGNSGSNSAALWRYSTGTVRQAYFKRAQFSNGLVVEARVIETQVPINPGDSGGPMLNDRGELVAVNCGTMTDQVNVSFGVDVAELYPLLARRNPDFGKSTIAQTPSRPVPPIQPATPSVAEFIRGKSWISQVPTASQQENLYWLTSFHADGTFTELVIDASGNIRTRTSGRYAIAGSAVTMTIPQGLHWQGSIEIVDAKTLIYVSPGDAKLTAVYVDFPTQTQAPAASPQVRQTPATRPPVYQPRTTGYPPRRTCH